MSFKFDIGDRVRDTLGEGTVRGRDLGNWYVVQFDRARDSYFVDADGLMPRSEDRLKAVVKTYEFGGVTFEDAGVYEFPKYGQWYLSSAKTGACFWVENYSGSGKRHILKPARQCQCK